MCTGGKGSYTSGSEGGATPEVKAGQVRLAAGEDQAYLRVGGDLERWVGIRRKRRRLRPRVKLRHCAFLLLPPNT